MHPALLGALVGLGLAIAIYVFDYMSVSRNAKDRAARIKKRPQLDPNERKALASLARFLVLVPPVTALLFWIFS
jgi:hypothetical protein